MADVVRGQLFEYAVIYHPRQTKEQAERAESPKSVLLIGPKTVLASSKEVAGTLAAREIPAEHIEHLEDIQIAVRPF
jgi:hypothetical protein